MSKLSDETSDLELQVQDTSNMAFNSSVKTSFHLLNIVYHLVIGATGEQNSIVWVTLSV